MPIAVADPQLRHRAEAAASRLPPLQVAAERVAATVIQGIHGRRRVGQGDSFWQFRNYEFGDSATQIDWRQSARSQRLFVRQNEWEAAQTVWLWRDASPSMRYVSDRTLQPKIDRAELLLVALSSLLVRAGERVALLGSGHPPTFGRHAVERMAALVIRREGSLGNLPAIERLPRHARVVLFGDFLSPLAEVDAIVRGLATAGLKGHLVQVIDPAEIALPFAGRVLFEGLEGETPLLVSRVETVREAYRERFALHTACRGDIARAAGWTHAIHHTDWPPHQALLALYGALIQREGP